MYPMVNSRATSPVIPRAKTLATPRETAPETLKIPGTKMSKTTRDIELLLTGKK